MEWFVWLFFLFSTARSLSYLDNNHTSLSWIDIPTDSILVETNSPYKGIGCTAYTNTNDLYFISSTNPSRYYYNQQYCDKSKKYVEILKYDFSGHTFTNSLLIGDNPVDSPNAVGGKAVII